MGLNNMVEIRLDVTHLELAPLSSYKCDTIIIIIKIKIIKISIVILKLLIRIVIEYLGEINNNKNTDKIIIFWLNKKIKIVVIFMLNKKCQIF